MALIVTYPCGHQSRPVMGSTRSHCPVCEKLARVVRMTPAELVDAIEQDRVPDGPVELVGSHPGVDPEPQPDDDTDDYPVLPAEPWEDPDVVEE